MNAQISLFGKSDITFGNYGLSKFRSSNNIPLGQNIASRISFAITERDGFSDNIVTGQDLDDASSVSIRGDLLIDFNENSSLRFFGQFFDRNFIDCWTPKSTPNHKKCQKTQFQV